MASTDSVLGENQTPALEYLNKTTVLKCYSTQNSRSTEQIVHLVGTAHVSKKSCIVVQNVIREVQPEAIFLELCRARSEILKPPPADSATKADMRTALLAWRKGQATLFDALYSWMLSRFGSEMEVPAATSIDRSGAACPQSLPGEEFRVAFEESRKIGAYVMLGDRPIQVTVKRMWSGLSFWEKCRLCWHLVVAGIDIPDKDEILKLFNEWEETDAITEVIREFSEMFPSISVHLIDERNLYMIHMLRELSHRASSIVAVVGAGHLPGIKENWDKEIDVSEIGALPKAKPSSSMWHYCLLASSCVALVSVVYLKLRATP